MIKTAFIIFPKNLLNVLYASCICTEHVWAHLWAHHLGMWLMTNHACDLCMHTYIHECKIVQQCLHEFI